MPMTADNPNIKYQPKVQGYSYSSSDPVPKSQSPINQHSGKSLNTILTLVFSILGFLFLFFVLLAVLNYFNILSISNLYPNQLSFLPESSFNLKATPTPKLQNENVSPDAPKVERFLQYPMPDGKSYILSSQYPTIVASETNLTNNTILVAVTLSGDKLTEPKLSNLVIDNKNVDYFVFHGLTIWYIIDEETTIFKKNPPGSESDYKLLGTGTNLIKDHLKNGDKFDQIISLVNGGTNDQPNLNEKTLNLIKSSVGVENIISNKMFMLYAAGVALP